MSKNDFISFKLVVKVNKVLISKWLLQAFDLYEKKKINDSK